MFTQLANEFNKNPQLDDDEGYQQIETVNCPFDSSHMMQPKNYLTHIYRCKSPNKHLYVQCRYDPCHWFYPQEKDKHHLHCPTRIEHYQDIDLEQGDWDDEEIQSKMIQKANNQKLQKRKIKILKIIAYLKHKKKIENQMQLQASTLTHKNPNSTTKQNESDVSTTYSQIKAKLIKMYKKNKNKHNQSLEISSAQSQLNFDKKQQSLTQKGMNVMMNGRHSIIRNQSNSYQYFYPPLNPLIPTVNLQAQMGMIPHHGIPMDPFSYQQYQQFQPLSPQSEYQPNLIRLGYSLSATNKVNYLPPYVQPPYPFVNSPYSVYSYQQPWQRQCPVPFRNKPQPEQSLRFEVNVNTESFVKKKIIESESKSQIAQANNKVNQFDAHSVVLSDCRKDQTSTNELKKFKKQFKPKSLVQLTKLQHQQTIKKKKNSRKDRQLSKQSQKNLTQENDKRTIKDKSQRKDKKKKKEKELKQQRPYNRIFEDSETSQSPLKKDIKQKQYSSNDREDKSITKKQAHDQRKQLEDKKNTNIKDDIVLKSVFDQSWQQAQKNYQLPIKPQQKNYSHQQIPYQSFPVQSQFTPCQNQQSFYQKQLNRAGSAYQEQKQQMNNTYQSNCNINKHQYIQRQQLSHANNKIKQMTSIPMLSCFPQKQIKQQSHKNYQRDTNLVKRQDIPQYEPILDQSISRYDLKPVNFSLNTTIKHESFRINDSKSQQSMDMKELLQVMNAKGNQQKYKEKKNELKLEYNKRDFGGY